MKINYALAQDQGFGDGHASRNYIRKHGIQKLMQLLQP